MEVLRRRRGVVARRTVASAAKAERQLPPRVPEELLEVDEALQLLGNYIQAVQTGGKLRVSLQQRLQELIGVVPPLETARAWKSGLKELRSEVAELERRVGLVPATIPGRAL